MAVRKKNTKEVPASGGRALKGVLAVAAVGILAGSVYLVMNPTEPKVPVHVASVREERKTVLDEKIPAAGGTVAPPQNMTPPAAVIPNMPADKPVAPPVSIADSTLKIGDPSKADPVEFALHPSHFADPSKLASKIGIVSISAEEPTTSPIRPTAAAPIHSQYEEAVRLEKARAFTMSMAQGLDGKIWIGSENTQPSDGTGGVQVWDPSKPPLEAFTQYVSDESAAKLKNPNIHGGLGDDNAYAIAVDLQGRVWAGHLNHGVSVFNGEKWVNYEVVGGLSRPDTRSGPLGERIFHITVCPKMDESITFKDSLTDKISSISGSVWMCTSAGLAIWFPSTDTWSYLTRSEGLPSDQANSLAFAQDGTVYVALQCDGIAFASAKDHYKTWKNVRGPNELPAMATGSGLPSNMMNDILVTRDGTIYATTTAGVAWSKDRAQTWQFMRGTDFSARSGPEVSRERSVEATLSDDYCTSIIEDSALSVHVGHRSTSNDLLVSGHPLRSQTGSDFTTDFLAVNTGLLASGFGTGVAIETPIEWPVRTTSLTSINVLPSAAETLSLRQLENTQHPIESTQPDIAAFMGEDWATRGNWVGRYGRSLSVLFAMGSPRDHVFSRRRTEFPYSVQLLANSDADKPRSWVQTLVATDPRALYDPQIGTRRIAGIDDHGEAYPRSFDGSGLSVLFTVPDGMHRMSAYFLNDNGHAGLNRYRDYEVALQCEIEGQWRDLARTRVTSHWGGVYKQFAIQGPAKLRMAIRKGTSLNVMCSGLFFDWAGGGVVPEERDPFLWMADVRLSPHSDSTPNDDSGCSILTENTLDKSRGSPSAYAIVRSTLLQLYRKANSNKNISPELLAQWKWNLGLWNDLDRREFERQMGVAWSQMQERVPALKSINMRPSSPGVGLLGNSGAR